MLFNSLQFAIFFPVVTLLYFLLPQKARVPLLLAASCVFYMAFVPKYILIHAALIAIDFAAGLWIQNAHGHRRKVFLIISLCANVGMLGFFKYFNFLNGNVAALAHFIGWNYSIESLQIILPIGLSFHTFQSMSYTIEVYRGNVRAERSLLYFATFVMFYPQLVAGPIERPQNLLHQFRETHVFNRAQFMEGAQLMLTGLFKKVIIADRAAILVNAVYADPGHFSGGQLLLATWLFAIQIYCDFCGYTEIARGAAKIMGFDLMVNFVHPYLASSIADFWRRWHISLSTWFRDYVYFPLGGNRCTVSRHCFNLAVVFLISGLWHGANWTYVIWGALHAAFIIVYVLTVSLRKQIASAVSSVNGRIMDFLGWLLTINLVAGAWIFFRAANLSDALMIVRKIFTDFAPSRLIDFHPGLEGFQFDLVVIVIGALLFLEYVGLRKPVWKIIDAQPRWGRWSAYYAFGLAFMLLMLLNPEHTAQPFIYFQF
jgi:D-alanyl-lipoteichoic acid acyltransferase DltB (MBOAT superfamily)